FAQHRDGEAERSVAAVVAVLVVDDVATRLPEHLARAYDPLRLAFELEQHLPLQHVSERRAGVAMWWRAGIAGRELADHGHRVRPGRDERRYFLLQQGERRLPCGRSLRFI